MQKTAYRWMMAAPNTPQRRSVFAPFPPQAGEVVVEVAGCGVCHTDLGYFFEGVRVNHALPLTLGHEISGTVVAVGDGEQQWLGRSVIVPAVMPCGTCEQCRRGRHTICSRQKMPGNDIQGGFASHVVVPGRGLCPVDPARLAAIGLDLADVAVVADALTTPYQAVSRAGVGFGSLVVVVGVGGVGGYCVQVARAFGATVVAIDVDAGSLATMAEHGAALTLDARTMDARALRAAIQDFAAQGGWPLREWFIFECSGTAAGQTTAYGLLVHGATLSVVGFTMEKVELRLSNLMAFDARALGNWGCAPDLYPAALELVMNGRVKVKPFVMQRPLGEINEVFDAVHRRAVTRRVVLVP
jgi:6-hydroxycyclohex-1-ene-1-carbonyl-CoA dehydrogenase